jgi:hypothetical protein
MSFHYAERILSDFCSSQGLSISFNSGAICLQQKDSKKWYIEITDDDHYLLFHHKVTTSFNVNPDQMSKLLQMNANYSLMGGAWMGIHNNTQSCRIFKRLEINSLTTDVIKEEINNFISLTKNIRNDFFN